MQVGCESMQKSKMKMKSSRELKIAMYDALKEFEKGSKSIGIVHALRETVVPVGYKIFLNPKNAILVTEAAKRVGLTTDEFVNQLIISDLNVAREFSNLRKEIKDLIE